MAITIISYTAFAGYNTRMHSEMAAQRNARLTYIATFLINSTFTLPIWLLFFTRQLHLGVTAAVALYLIRWATSAAANILTGAWADRFGRVRMCRIGLVVVVLSYVPFFVTTNFWVLVAAQLVGGFAWSMTDGSLEPNVMDSYEAAGLKTHAYGRFASNNLVWTFVARIISGLVGAWAYTRLPYSAVLLESLALAAALAAVAFITEVRVEHATARNNKQHISEAVQYIWRHRQLLLYFALMMSFSFGAESIWTALQPYFLLRDLPAGWFGGLFALVAGMSAVSAYSYRHIQDKIAWQWTFIGTGLVLLAGTLLTLVPFVGVPFIASVILGASFGYIWPVGDVVIKEYSRPKYRSTIMSVRQLVYVGLYSVASMLVGRYVDLFGTLTMLKILGIQALVLTFVVVWLALLSLRRPA